MSSTGQILCSKIVLISCSCTTSINNCLFEFEAAQVFQTWRSQSSFSGNLPWTACWFVLVCNMSISLSFPAPTLSSELNSIDKTIIEIIEWLLWSNRFEQRKEPSSGSQPLLGFWGGGGRDEVQKVFVQGSVQGKILWNHFWEHRFSVPDPRVFPPPRDRFLHRRPKTEFITGPPRKGASQ